MLANYLHLSLDELKVIFFGDLSIYDTALVYILIYVVYKALGRYVFFRPQEHASKINRTFLVTSLFVVGLNILSHIALYVPILPEYKWLFILSCLVLLISPWSILAHRVVWKYSKNSTPSLNDWAWRYLPIQKEYFKTVTGKSENHGNGNSSHWEEETVQSTHKNLHSDALINIFALLVFMGAGIKWTFESYLSFGWMSLLFGSVLIVWISSIFVDCAVFAWIEYFEKRRRL